MRQELLLTLILTLPLPLPLPLPLTLALTRCGKNYFRRDAAARRACVQESQRLVAFVEARIEVT